MDLLKQLLGERLICWLELLVDLFSFVGLVRQQIGVAEVALPHGISRFQAQTLFKRLDRFWVGPGYRLVGTGVICLDTQCLSQGSGHLFILPQLVKEGADPEVRRELVRLQARRFLISFQRIGILLEIVVGIAKVVMSSRKVRLLANNLLKYRHRLGILL